MKHSAQSLQMPAMERQYASSQAQDPLLLTSIRQHLPAPPHRPAPCQIHERGRDDPLHAHTGSPCRGLKECTKQDTRPHGGAQPATNYVLSVKSSASISSERRVCRYANQPMRPGIPGLCLVLRLDVTLSQNRRDYTTDEGLNPEKKITVSLWNFGWGRILLQ